MNRYKLIWRAGQHIWGDEAVLNALLDTLTKDGRIADECNLFISEPSSHANHPLPEVAGRCEVFRRAARAIRARDMRVGIDQWPTFGAGDTAIHDIRPMPFQPMVSVTGEEARRVACPISPEFLEYTRQKFKLFASADPDFVWIDDDCRFTHLSGPEYPCFCPRCVAGFENGAYPDRESLVSALNRPENRDLRRKWCEYGAERLALYCKTAREAVDEVDPSIDVPFMTVGYTHTTYSGNYIEACMDAAQSRAARPGHGFYWDEEPRGMFKKTMDVARQVQRYPEHARGDIQYEEESHPITPLNKATEIRLLEAGLSIWAGCNGIAFNSLTISGGPRPFGHMDYAVKRWNKARSFLDRYLDFAADLPQVGMWVAENEFMMAGMNAEKGWFHESDPAYDIQRIMGEWPEMGIALSADPTHAYATVLQGRVIETFDDAQIKAIFEKPVFLDATALQVLEKRGMASYAGVRCGESLATCVEILTDSRLNGPFAGCKRHALFDPGVSLIPDADDVEILSRAIDPYGVDKGACVTRRGNVTVFSYSPYQFIGTVGYLYRMRALMKEAGAPVLLEPKDPYGINRLSAWARSDGNRAAVLLINAALDPATDTDLVINGNMKSARILGIDRKEQFVPTVCENGTLRISLPEVGAWEMLLVLAK